MSIKLIWVFLLVNKRLKFGKHFCSSVHLFSLTFHCEWKHLHGMSKLLLMGSYKYKARDEPNNVQNHIEIWCPENLTNSGMIKFCVRMVENCQLSTDALFMAFELSRTDIVPWPYPWLVCVPKCQIASTCVPKCQIASLSQLNTMERITFTFSFKSSKKL